MNRAPCRHVPAVGFSLIELFIVVLVLGIFAAAAAPKFADALSAHRVDMAAHRLASDLRAAQARAKALSATQSVTFVAPPNGNQYEIVGMKNPDRPADSYVVRLSEAPYHATLVSVSLEGNTALTFNGYGLPGCAATIVLRSGARTRTVRVERDAGTVSIE
ncbi:MAG: GspH/FimT family pseudopilin [Thermoguttaceae bacterium]|nr:GspH/FimT family pseudopilin [Thermoguttaceae bacterium]